MAASALSADQTVGSNRTEGRMNFADSLWHLVQHDRLVRWGAYASAVLVWFAVAWADVRILLALPATAAAVWLLMRQRERHGWLAEREDDVDLL